VECTQQSVAQRREARRVRSCTAVGKAVQLLWFPSASNNHTGLHPQPPMHWLSLPAVRTAATLYRDPRPPWLEAATVCSNLFFFAL
jgi:hypothetical protein